MDGLRCPPRTSSDVTPSFSGGERPSGVAAPFFANWGGCLDQPELLVCCTNRPDHPSTPKNRWFVGLEGIWRTIPGAILIRDP